MKNLTNNSTRSLKLNSPRGFTLVEILVVIAIISIVATLGFQGASIVTRKRDRARVEVQLEQLKLAIEDYKLRFGTYPPDNPSFCDELTASGGAVINNMNKPASIGSSRSPKNYLPSLTANDFYVHPSGVRDLRVPVPYGGGPFTWKYDSSNPPKNSSTYDIWAVYPEGGDTSRMITIGNWK